MENLADLGSEPEREPSYMFYNAGLELERQYREETRRIDEQRRCLETQQREAADKLEEARRELEFLRSQQQRASEVRSAEESERRKELDASHQQLEIQKKYLEDIREEQELARERAEDEIRQVKERIRQDQEEEKQRLEAEMQRLMALEEDHRKKVQSKNRRWERSRKIWRRNGTENEDRLKCSGKRLLNAVRRQLRQQLGQNPRKSRSLRCYVSDSNNWRWDYEEQRKTAQREVTQAKDSVRRVEQETLEGLRSLTTGKSAIEGEWRRLEEVQAKHKRAHDQSYAKIRDVREMLESAEEMEEASLVEKEKMIMERRAARMKVEEARRRLEELEHEDKDTAELTEADFTKKKELLEFETREEIKDIREEGKS
ncbi:hypothetical protein OS493_020316 [Desmophyllum pertusum]|uniref:Uncharacterized protein n=1 Tax=Desmophyllum pertusum TaxID=174260 RepID=A0A9W9ZRL7_9CNID|nr:hypothetical protein OS493_020316 [Desmophyllum pertusum]